MKTIQKLSSFINARVRRPNNEVIFYDPQHDIEYTTLTQEEMNVLIAWYETYHTDCPNRELIASVIHDIWIHWMEYFQGKVRWRSNDRSWIIPVDVIVAWQRKMSTPYTDLSEEEKESDRRQADKIIKAITNA